MPGTIARPSDSSRSESVDERLYPFNTNTHTAIIFSIQ